MHHGRTRLGFGGARIRRGERACSSMSDEVPDVCPTCKAEISWSEWSRARVDESLVHEKGRSGWVAAGARARRTSRPGPPRARTIGVQALPEVHGSPLVR